MNDSPPDFERLVLGCIKADFCDKILILQHFSRSRRSANLCTATNSKFSIFFNFSPKFTIFFEIFANLLNFLIFRSDFHRNLPEFHRISAILILQLQNFRKLVKIQKKMQKKFKKIAYCRLAGCFQKDPSPPSSHISTQ